jgi:hypothetical protein
MRSHADILQDLVCFEKPPKTLLRELKSFGWDGADEPLVVLPREYLLRTIERFLAIEISAAQRTIA